MVRLLLVLLFSFSFGLTTAKAQVGQSPAYVAPGGIGVSPTGCRWIGSVAGSCLPATDTTDQVVAPRPNASGWSDTYGFSPAGGVLTNGNSYGICDAEFSGTGDCTITTQLRVCATPGNVATNSHPWSNEGIVSWSPTGAVGYDARNSGIYLPGVPAFSPPITIESTVGSLSAGVPWNWISYMAAVCGASTNSYFVDAVLGEMPNLRAATAAMSSNDTLAVGAPPPGFPYWPSGENTIGSNSGSANPTYNLTVNFDPAASFGYPAPNDKGFLKVENNGTTINGGKVFWVNPGNNQAAIAWDSGLDLTVNDFYADTAGMGLFRATVRSGITILTNDIFANIGCMDNACAYGHNHNIYIGTVASSGFDDVIADNLSDPDVLENGWNLKMRSPNSNITDSFFGARVNNGASSSHGPIDYPCGGAHNVAYSALETNQYSFDSALSNQESNFLVAADEERASNVATTPTGSTVSGGGNCPTTVWVPNSVAIPAIVTGPGSFTTTVNPVTFIPLITFESPNSANMWDLGASGMMANGPAGVNSWTGPDVNGLYTVQMSACFNGEGTIPLTNPGYGIYACFVGTGPITLYATGGVVPVLTNTPTTASISVPVDPHQFGFLPGDTLNDPSNALSIASIDGNGPYTINLTCSHPANFSGPNCIESSDAFTIVVDPTSSGVYDPITGNVSLTLGSDVGFAAGSVVNIQNLFGTGAVASLNGTFTATEGTDGKTLNYTAAKGLVLTIGGSSGGPYGVAGLTFPANMDSLEKTGPIQLIASTTGVGCDDNTLCGIQYDPRGQIVWHGEQVVGTGVSTGYDCMTAGQITSIYPVGGATGTNFSAADIGKTIQLVGGTAEVNAVITVASVAGGKLTGVNVTTGGVYTAFTRTFTQGVSTVGGTGAQFQFPHPAPIVGGSAGNYTLRLARSSGEACVTSAVTNQVYQLQTPTDITFDHDLIGWDGLCPNRSQCTLLAIINREPWNRAAISNSVIWTDVADGGPVWGTGDNSLGYGMTDGGGNIRCNNRTDLATSPRCAMPPFTAASFIGDITGAVLTAPGAAACRPGMYVWDNQGQFQVGSQGVTISGTRIVAGAAPDFTVAIPSGGVVTTDISNGPLNCGWGMLSSAFNGQIDSNGVLTINKDLVGSIHANNYLADIFGVLPDNIKVLSGSGAVWQTTYRGPGVVAEYMVGVR